MSGKKIRLARFVARNRPSLIVPIDHGLTMGPLAGLGSSQEIARWLTSPVIDGVIAHKGMIERLAQRDLLGRAGVMMHLNGMSLLAPRPDVKERLTSMETAVRLGADGVSVQVNFDGCNDAGNLTLLGQVTDEAARFGLPVLAMVYDKVAAPDRATELGRMRHLMRIAIEMGIDALKIGAPSDLDALDQLLEGISHDMPVFFAGGASHPDDVLALARRVSARGVSGLCVGRSVFQHADPRGFLTQLSAALRAEQQHGPAAALDVTPASTRTPAIALEARPHAARKTMQ